MIIFLGNKNIYVILGVAAEWEITTRMIWIAAKLSNWGSLRLNHLNKCLMTALEVFKRKVFFDISIISLRNWSCSMTGYPLF